jgi:precorrin-2 C20-methyltransferase/precorrin-3B C17-methyltransferase
MTEAKRLGRLFGVGVGPGDPELMTIKARNTIEAADVIAYPGTEHGPSVARQIAAPYLRESQIEVALRYPVTTGDTDHPGGYEAAISEFYDAAAQQVAEHLERGLDVAVLCAGDPFLYGSYMYLHDRLAPRFEARVIPGVTSFSAAAASAGTPLVRRDDVLTILPGTLSPEALTERLRGSEAAVVLKLGRTFEKVRDSARSAGVADRGVYVERASSERERSSPLEAVEGKVPYMSLVLIPSATVTGVAEVTESPATSEVPRGSLAVVGLGPAGPEWLTPEAAAELAAAEHIVGYETYIARVPERAGQQRHASDNRAELERARHALALAAGGARVAVVSSGDPGIFAMAAAVLEAAEEPDAQLDVEIRVIPGLSAMQAAAARVGAPLGHDFCVLSLSDQLKPWDVIERRLDAAGAADMVLALYNPASRSRREQLDRAVAVLAKHRAPDTPVVVARAVGDTDETITVTSLGELDTATVDMRTLLIVGSSTTRTVAVNGGKPRVYTPRSYPA